MTAVPKVSVIVPNYNYRKYFDRRMESILAQTYTDFEIIILDDASTDGSKDVIEKYRNNEKVSCIVFNEKNTGLPCIQWEKGCSLAKGEYIWIAEADDLSSPDFLLKAVEALEEWEKAVLCFSGSHEINDIGTIREDEFMDRISQPLYNSHEDKYVFPGKFYLEHYLAWANTIYNASGCVFRKTSLDDNDWDYCKKFHKVGDWALWSHIVPKGNVIILKDKLNFFRRHDSCTTFRLSKQLAYHIEKITLVEHNTKNLSAYKRLVIVNRLKRSLLRAADPKDQKAILNNIDMTFGRYTVKKAAIIRNINTLAGIIPRLHISQRNDRRIKPKATYNP